MRRFLLPILILLIGIFATVLILTGVGFRYAYEPSRDAVMNRTRPSPEAYDLWGRAFTQEEAAELLQTSEGRAQLSPKNGAVKIDDALLQLGRTAFYKETFSNQLFLTDIVGILDGPLRITNVATAILGLKGEGTANLRVRVPETVTIGNRTFPKDSYFDTGLDVARGAIVPLGMAVSVSRWRIRVGITCALCHATVDPETRNVVEGAPNQDLNAGVLLALGTNSAAYFMHTDVNPRNFPSHDALEKAVDAALVMWPRGSFDSLTDMKADPTQNPVSLTWGNHPYGWSGNFMAGPFRGLSSQNNNVHALNSDSLLLADESPALLDMDKETFLAIVLRNAAYKKYRFDPSRGQNPSQFFASIRPTPGSPGINQAVMPPTHPKGTLISPDGTLTSSPGYPFWQQNNAMAAWQDTIVPPSAKVSVDSDTKARGRHVFKRALCTNCHSGPFLTNNTVIPNKELGANGIRAMALEKTEGNFAAPVLYTFDTPVPLPRDPQRLPVPIEHLDSRQIDLAWAHHGSGGGYKVPSLAGLYWSAPYLHDGGVSVGKNRQTELGLPGTVERNVAPDPASSLDALLNRELRSRVVAANEASPALRRMNVQGIGHNFWVDRESGFTDEDRQALILYLLSFEPDR
jgi:hypothetical protein